jgi:hypothetical protein
MEEYDASTLAELSDTDLDLVAGGRGSLVNIGSIDINVGVLVGNQINIAVLSIANQANVLIQGLTQH